MPAARVRHRLSACEADSNGTEICHTTSCKDPQKVLRCRRISSLPTMEVGRVVAGSCVCDSAIQKGVPKSLFGEPACHHQPPSQQPDANSEQIRGGGGGWGPTKSAGKEAKKRVSPQLVLAPWVSYLTQTSSASAHKPGSPTSSRRIPSSSLKITRPYRQTPPTKLNLVPQVQLHSANMFGYEIITHGDVTMLYSKDKEICRQ